MTGTRQDEIRLPSLEATNPGRLVANGYRTLQLGQMMCSSGAKHVGGGGGLNVALEFRFSERVVIDLLGDRDASRLSARQANRRGRRTGPCGGGGEGSYRGLGAEGGGAMLERVGTVAVRSGGGGALAHAAHWVDGPRSGLWRRKKQEFTPKIPDSSLLASERMRTQNEGTIRVKRNICSAGVWISIITLGRLFLGRRVEHPLTDESVSSLAVGVEV